MKTLIAMMMAVALAGCSLFQSGTSPTPATFDVCSAASAVGAEEAAAVSAVSVVVQLHASKQMTDANYAQAQTAYAALQSANGLILTALIEINDAGGSPSAVTPQQYAQLLAQAAIAAAQFYAIYSSSTNQAGPPAALPGVSASATTCSITDAQLTAQLTMPNWPAQ
jgi:hypothetical protein